MSADLSSPPLASQSPSPVDGDSSALRIRLAQRRRAHQLAGDQRAGTWAREQARRAWWAFARRQWRPLAAMAGTAAVGVTALAWFVPTSFARGLIVGAGVTATLAALGLLIVQATGTAQLSSGATAEQWTAGELRRLRAHGWRIINHVGLKDYDIDHVLVGPGGVITVETKWSHRDWRTKQSRPWLNAAVEQAIGNARTLRLWLKTYGVTDVSAVVFCWSAHRPERGELPPQPGTVGTTQIVYGTQAADAWRHSLTDHDTGPRLNNEQITEIWNALERHIRRRDNAPATTTAPPTLYKIYWTGLSILITFAAGLLGNLNTLTATKSWGTWTAVTITQAALGLAALRNTRLRRLAASWLIAVTCAAMLAAISIIISIT